MVDSRGCLGALIVPLMVRHRLSGNLGGNSYPKSCCQSYEQALFPELLVSGIHLCVSIKPGYFAVSLL
jgi:hypothetical protein